jgi:hypothetical protein
VSTTYRLSCIEFTPCSNPEHKHPVDRLGQESYLPSTQCFGSYSDDSGDNWANFEALAKEYVIDGEHPAIICSHNAEVRLLSLTPTFQNC